MYSSVSKKDAKFESINVNEIDIKIDFEKLTESEMLIWEVFFDHRDKATGKGKRIDPLILDLNKDGKFDITGANQEGNGKIDGDTVKFDIDPSKQSWRRNSPGHRPGWYEGRKSHLVASIPNGKAIYNTGKTENLEQKVSGKTIQIWVSLPKSMMPIVNGLVNGSLQIGDILTAVVLDGIILIRLMSKKKQVDERNR